MKTVRQALHKSLSVYLAGGLLCCLPIQNAFANDLMTNLALPANTTVLISLLVLLCSILAYRMLKYRLELLNIQAIDFHGLADNAHDGILIVQDKKLVYSNERAAEILAYSGDELLKLTLADIVHPDEAEEVVEIHLRRLRGEDVPKQYEATFLNKHDNKVPVELTAAVTSWQTHKAALIIFRDITDRMLIQQTLQDSEKRYRSLVENSPDGIVIFDVERDALIEANEQVCKMFGRNKQAMFELKIAELSLQTGTNQKPLAHYLERALHGQPLIFEHRFINSADQAFNCEVRLSRMPFPKRRLVRANLSDLSERMQYQSTIRQTEERLRNFFEASFEILFFHENGIVTDVNNQVEKVFGFTQQEIIGHHVLEYVAPESHELAKTNMAQEVDTPYELIALHKDGHTFPVQIQGKTTEYDGRKQRIVSVVDISALKDTHHELAMSQQNMQNIIDNMLDTFYRTDKHGRIIMISPSVETLFGYKADEVLGTPLASYYADPYARQFFLDTLKNNDGVIRGYDTAMRHKAGHVMWVSTYARYYYDQDGAIAGVEGITRDISEQRNYQLALNQANEELEIKIDRRTRQLQEKITELEKVQLELINSEKNFRILVENAVDTFLLHDIKGNIVDVNKQACKSLGYSRDELLNMNIGELDVGPDPISFKDLVDILKQEDNYHIQSILQRKDGSQFPAEINIGLLKKGRKQLILALVRDTSHRTSLDDKSRQKDHKPVPA